MLGTRSSCVVHTTQVYIASNVPESIFGCFWVFLVGFFIGLGLRLGLGQGLGLGLVLGLGLGFGQGLDLGLGLVNKWGPP